ncbi:hypothetical protein G6F57_011749 [Rhizopus arrhizus]|nr:hypothetical protein G6F57_011749 [Rhizopus arrhizus]
MRRLPWVGLPTDSTVLGHHRFAVAGEKYVRALVEAADVTPLVLPSLQSPLPASDWLQGLDGLLLTGAVSTIAPQHDAGGRSWPGNPHDPARDANAFALLQEALALDLPPASAGACGAGPGRPSRGPAGAGGGAVWAGPRGHAGGRWLAGAVARGRARAGQFGAWAGHRPPGAGAAGRGGGRRRAGRGGAQPASSIRARRTVAPGVACHAGAVLSRYFPCVRPSLPAAPTEPTGFPMSSRTRPRKTATPPAPQESSLLRWLKERRITEVECLVPDITGNARGKIIPADKFSHDYGTRLPEGIFATTVTGEFPDDYYDLTSPSDSDMILRPDPDTVRMVPWATDPTAQIIHDCYTKTGEPHELAPRNVLRRVLDAYAELGLRPVVAPELEFFLVQKNTDPDFPLLPPAGRSGRPETARQSYSIDAVNDWTSTR